MAMGSCIFYALLLIFPLPCVFTVKTEIYIRFVNFSPYFYYFRLDIYKRTDFTGIHPGSKNMTSIVKMNRIMKMLALSGHCR